MAHARRSPQHRAPSSSISSPSTTRRNTLRRSASRLASHAPSQFISSLLPQSLRPVLVPLQPNLRPLPSRSQLVQKDEGPNQLMRDSSHVITGSKRKRVVSSNENAHTHGRSTRGSGRLKRLRTVQATSNFYRPSTSEESQSEASEMEVDAPSVEGVDSEQSDVDESQSENIGGEDEESYDSYDFLINSAPQRTLTRLLKHRLIELYELSGLAGDAESLTKSDIIDAIVGHRDDVASVPPSSPPGKVDASSDYSSDDGHVAGGEETDVSGPRPSPNGSLLKRRVTVHDIGKVAVRPVKNRSLSMGNLLGNGEAPKTLLNKRKASMQLITDTESMGTRRRASSRSSPTISVTTPAVKTSPPATRLRSRVASTSILDPNSPASTTSKNKGKGKTKQVEFSSAVEIRIQTPSKRSSKGKELEKLDSESDLTELEEDSDHIPKGQPSPRRLRSKDRELEKFKEQPKEDLDATPMPVSKQRKRTRSADGHQGTEVFEGATGRRLRVTPMRKAKGNVGCLKESDDDEEQEDEEDELREEGEEGQSAEVDEDVEEEEEVDELVSSASITPPVSRGRRTAVRRRLRPRRARNKAAPSVEEENEGDDEEEEEEEGEAQEEGEEEAAEEEEEEDDEATIAVEPRKLRNGKIVGEEDVEMDVDTESVIDEEEGEVEDGEEGEVEDGEEGEVEDGEEGEGEGEGEEEEEEEEGEDGEEADVADAESIDIDTGETDEDETMEDDVDLTVATAKTLVRLRRDDLVRLCETRDLDPSGTKPQLAEALLQWRDRQGNEFSSPSSAGTVRPSSNRKKRRTKRHSSSSAATTTTVPVLLRSEYTHTDEPRTPIPSKEKEKENEELELDLESLGLEDREIPPEKLTKLEKIGSGGFKDVFIGKFKNRKIAISEFRGQLSAMDIKELKLLGAFNHPNIVRFLGVSIPENTKETPVMIVSELCSNGDLFDYIRNTNAPSLHKVLQMMLDIARGLEYLHTRKPSIIHRDCKSSNILITAKGTAKIADFGLAKVKQSTRSMVRSLVGTVNWQAPELWHAHPKYNHKVDVFSCAMVYWEMLQWHAQTKKFPWEGMNEHAIYEIVGAKRQRPSLASLRKQWCPEIVDFIERMWAQEHQERPTMTEVVEFLEELAGRY
ncbi:hypothetical protein GALMADRAFT_142074 [Galerina marginata CBS 339.88]|uniref:Protein kinase domain-containing protein n=1 Tax=Galerina marginata (strain CBS 339.88) TaxID=685588 RepID=A0A067SRN2_GALM3|nr:hypothetical protein GALMADRAFT_142074 [Galerina marginata CBS 339.88]